MKEASVFVMKHELVLTIKRKKPALSHKEEITPLSSPNLCVSRFESDFKAPWC